MICGANQPYFIPYLGYWQLINAVDVFKISDDYNFIKRGWIGKNRILINGAPSNFRVEIDHVTSNKKINELMLGNVSVKEKMKTLMFSYGRAPFFNDGMKLMEEIFSCNERNLAGFLVNSMYCVSEYLDIKTKFILSSSLNQPDDLKREHRIYDYCEKMGADTYYNAIGGTKLYSFEGFKNHGIELGFLKMDDIVYKQLSDVFVPGLSIIDVIMFNSKEEINKLLTQYTILKEGDI